MKVPRDRSHLRRVERWLWTGPLGHLAGGALDFAQALVYYRRSGPRGARVRARVRARARRGR
jgi:hypothetical protein